VFPQIRSIMDKAVADITDEVVGQRLSPDDVMLRYSVLQFVVATRAANDAVLKTGNRFDLRLYFGQALRAGNEVKASNPADPVEAKAKKDIAEMMPPVRQWVNVLKKDCPGTQVCWPK